MQLFKKKKDNKGYVITVIVGKTGYNSYWSAPPIYGVDKHNRYDFDLEYIRNRYPIINTKERAKQFSGLYKNLWIDITDKQLELMKHSLGLTRNKKPYRNYFFTLEDDKDWNELVEKGLAIKGKDHPNDDKYIYFFVSKQGLEFVLGKSVSDKVYNEI